MYIAIVVMADVHEENVTATQEAAAQLIRDIRTEDRVFDARFMLLADGEVFDLQEQ